MSSGEEEEENEMDGWMRETQRERIEINSKLTESAYDTLPLCLSSLRPSPPPPSPLTCSRQLINQN